MSYVLIVSKAPVPHCDCLTCNLLPTGSEERGVLRFRNIPVAIFPSHQDTKKIALQLH